MTPTSKQAKLTLVRVISKKQLTRASDGHKYEVHNLIAKSDKGNEFECSMFADLGAEVELGTAKNYQIDKSQRGEWLIRELRERPSYGGGAAKGAGQEIHAASLNVACQLLIAGKVKTVEDMLALSRQIAERTIIHWRQTK